MMFMMAKIVYPKCKGDSCNIKGTSDSANLRFLIRLGNEKNVFNNLISYGSNIIPLDKELDTSARDDISIP